MFKKKKNIFLIAGLVIVLIVLVKIIPEIPYRSNIPSFPDLTNVSDSLRNQIKEASSNAYRNPTSDNLGMLGMVYHSSTNYKEAAVCYELAVKRDNSKWIWSYYLGSLNMEMGESEKAIENFKTVLKLNPDAHLAWYYLGVAYENIGANDKAELALLNIESLKGVDDRGKSPMRTDHFTLNIYARYQMARIYMKAEKLGFAENVLRQILYENRSFGAAYRLLGDIYSKKGNKALSDQFILRANDLITYNIPVDNLMDKLTLLSKSDLYLMKQIDEAKRTIYPEWVYKLISNALQVMPENKYVISKAVKFYVEIGAAKLAFPLLTKHLDYYKEDANEINEVAELLDKNGAYSQSLPYFSQALKLNPKATDQKLSLVFASYNAGMKEKALVFLDELINKDKNNIAVISRGIYVLMTLGETEKAKAYLAELKGTALTNPKVQQCAGMIAEREGKTDVALAQYEKSFGGDPSDLNTIEMLGNILVKKELWKRAIEHFRKALTYHPNEAFLLEKLGTLLITCPEVPLRKIDEGIEYAQRAVDHKSCTAETAMSAGSSLSEAYTAKNDKKTAMSYLNMVIDLAQNSNAPKDYQINLQRKLNELSQ
jgi:tetratricopeptide (TPR) repeat protein